MTTRSVAPVLWRPVVGFEPYYEVSNEGVVFSRPRAQRNWRGIYTTRPKRLRVSINGTGVRCVSFRVQRQQYFFSLARVVARAFLPPPTDARMRVCHRDGNPNNNQAANLFWATPEEISNRCNEKRRMTLRARR